MTLVDTNVLLDFISDDPQWGDWSEQQLEAAISRGPVIVSDIVYAEVSVRFARLEDVDLFLEDAGIDVQPVPRPGLFLAGKAYRTYRDRGGTRTGVLPDFLIGGHAAVAGVPLLTRDVARYLAYFPTLTLIAPV
jgi:predicted nucleic acid-binding protein